MYNPYVGGEYYIGNRNNTITEGEIKYRPPLVLNDIYDPMVNVVASKYF